nr:uncharacterized protein LOC127317086 [Lolium perenne]
MAGSSHHRRCLVVILLIVVLQTSLYVSSAAASTPLAAERTRRKDPLDGLRYYGGGWNISDRHYIASVAFSAAPAFAAAAVWFVAFALAGLVACCCRCCRGGTISDYSYSRKKFAVSLILVLAFTAAAVIGCAVLYDGQGKLDWTAPPPRALPSTIDERSRVRSGCGSTFRPGTFSSARLVSMGTTKPWQIRSTMHHDRSKVARRESHTHTHTHAPAPLPSRARVPTPAWLQQVRFFSAPLLSFSFLA